MRNSSPSEIDLKGSADDAGHPGKSGAEGEYQPRTATGPGSRGPTACRDRRPRSRIITPIRVRLRASHIPIPMRTAAAKMTSRTSGYCRNTASPLDLTAQHDGPPRSGPADSWGYRSGSTLPPQTHTIRSEKMIGQSERHQRLTQILPLHPPKDEKLHGDADDRGANEGDDVAEQPRSGQFAGLIAHIAAEQIERAMRQVDIAHQAEDQE